MRMSPQRSARPVPEKVASFLAAHGNLFQQPWWLDAVCVPPWSWEYLWLEKGDEVVAAWPLPFKLRLGRRLLETPPPTPYLGPVLRPSSAKYANRLGEEKEILGTLIDHLPPFASFSQHLSPGSENWLPFHWRGFSQTGWITYVIPSLANLNAVWKETLDRVRTDIRKAEQAVTVAEGSVDELLGIYRMTFARQEGVRHHPIEVVRGTVVACLDHSCGRIFLAKDPQGRPHAGCFVAWDSTSAYYLLGGGDPELRNSGAGSLALWRAIQFVAALPGNPRAFDFEGSMVEPIERFVRAWGGRQTPYHAISKTPSSALRVYRALVRAANRLSGRR